MKRPLLFLPLLLVAGCGTTDTSPGTYKDWEGELDSVEIVEKFHLSAYTRILVSPIDASAVGKSANSNTQSSLDAIIEDSTRHIAEKLQTKLPGHAHITVTTVAGNVNLKGNPTSLIFKPRFTTVKIGSSTARMFTAGFAGGSKITLEGEVIDGGTGRTLLRFSKANSHSLGGVVVNINTRVLEDNEDEIVESVGELFKAFYP